MSRIAVLALLVLCLASFGAAQMSGAYTIDPAKPATSLNFKTFSSCIAALYKGGISGPVTIGVASTIYKETVTFNGNVAGTSGKKPVTFIAPGARAQVMSTGQDGLVLNSNCRFLNFENIWFNGATRYALYMFGSSSAGRCQWCVFRKCRFEAPASTSSSVCSAKLDYPWDCHFQDCEFAGGGWAVYSQQQTRLFYERCEFDGKNTCAYLISPFNNNDADNTYINCFFHSCGAAGRLVYWNWSQYGNIFWNNTIIGTSSNELVFNGSCCAWTRCNSFRNNIVVQLGKGPCLEYGFGTNGLDYNDADNNCYYAPNAAGVLQAEGRATLVSLAGWKKAVGGKQLPIISGGGTSYDQNSIEADPKLVSMKAPYDIHLQAGSPCIDAVDPSTAAGKWIQGSWVSVPANHPLIPTSVTDDIDGQTRGKLVDIGADETSIGIVLSGTPSPGGTVNLDLTSASDAGLAYQVGTSLGNGPIPIGSRNLELTLDGVLQLSVSGAAPLLFANYVGVLNSQGKAKASIVLPNIAALKGTRLYNAFVSVKASAPFGLESISPSVLLTIQ